MVDESTESEEAGHTDGDEPDGGEDGVGDDVADATDRVESSGNGGDATSSSGGHPTEGTGTDDADRAGDPDHGGEDESLDPDELTVAERSLHPRIRVIWIARTILLGLVLGGLAAAGLYVELDVPLVLSVLVVPVPAILLVPIPILRYRIWRYEIRDDSIYLERGVFTRIRTVVPYVRIQHVDTSRGPIERATGLATLVVYTAGSRGADVTVPGLALEDAEDHQRRLKQLAIAAEDDTAV